MEILNKNQRQTAIWRLIFFLLFVLVVNGFVLFSVYQSFKDRDSGEEERLKKQLQEMGVTSRNKHLNLATRLKEMEGQISKLEADKNKVVTESATMKSQYDILKSQYDFVNQQLAQCNMLRAGGS